LTAKRSSSEAGTRALVSVQRAQLTTRFEARKRRVEGDHEQLRPLCRRHPGSGLADQQPHMGTHRIENNVVLAHDQNAPVVIGL